ncbi:cold shock domain-containing protein [Nocardia yunnanensis]|uniref:Cold shock domain-containing protein n=1 Tax=Nocardia yunnanensis TaxID=2382165 RepID=A0A386ZBV0_9NOCA|nr:cold shock domain-containing protein [Nocardia yunnanensis]AYF74564.1 cold shock domain-containing protein [Nocardia yunnanensis]
MSVPAALTLPTPVAEPSGRRLRGTVLWFDAAKGFGFISIDDQPQRRLFVEYSAIDVPGYRTLSGQQPVTFTIERNARETRAAAVRPA